MKGRAVFLALVLTAAGLEALEVTITAPGSRQPVFGSVEVTAAVFSENPVRLVELHVDGRLVGRSARPPYEWTVEVGRENISHRFEVVAEDINGERAHAIVQTPPVQIDEEVDVELHQLYVTVSRGGEAVRDLGREDFTVIDGGERQQLVTFERGDVPLTALLLVDASESMRGERLEIALASALAFIGDMQLLDEAMLLLFSEHIVHSTPFTGFREVLSAGLENVSGAGGTALNDHLYVALKLLEERQGRRVVVLLSDGIDSASVLEMQEVLWAARRSQALVYWFRLALPGRGHTISSAWRNAQAYRDELAALEQLTRQSGGEILELRGIEEAPSAFADIMHELRNQYVLGYYPSDARNDGSWRRVRVRAAGNLKLRYRGGYLDY